MTVIITGGSGLIGRALTKELTDAGYEVIILSRSPEKVDRLPLGATAHQWNGSSAEGWGHLADGATAIVNLAGAGIADGRWTAERKREILESRIEAGQAVVDAVKQAKVKPQVVIQASAVGYYGPSGDEKLTEGSAKGHDFLADVCQQWEASSAPIRTLGVRLVTIRTGVVLSHKGGALPKMALPFKFFVGGPVGRGTQWLPWIHLTDQVRAIRFLMETKAASGPFNLSAPNPLTNAEFSRVMGQVLARPALAPAPAFAMKLAFGEMATVLLDGQRALPKKLLELGFTFRHPEAKSALEEILATYRHRFEVRAPIAAVQDFHARSSSMGAITPPPIITQIHQAPPILNEGDEMDFSLWFGPFPLRWLARIENVRQIGDDLTQPNQAGFHDRQLKGPFDHWLHKHTFNALDDQTTEVVDEIELRLSSPFIKKAIGLNMWLTLPILFAYRAWQTKRLLENGEATANYAESESATHA